MPSHRQADIAIRLFEGVNLTSDGRVDNPGGWQKLKNLYRKTLGKLTKRPGSSIAYSTVEYDAWDLVTSNYNVLAQIGAGNDGVNALWPTVLGGSVGSELTIRGCVGLTSVQLTDDDNETLVGAYRFSQLRLTPAQWGTGVKTVDTEDVLFYVDSAGTIQLIPTLDGTLQASGQQWFFEGWPVGPAQDVSAALATTQRVSNKFLTNSSTQLGVPTNITEAQEIPAPVLLATNRIDPVVAIWNHRLVNSLTGAETGRLKAAPLLVKLATTEATVHWYVSKVQALAQWNGGLVFGGAQMVHTLGADYAAGEGDDLRNYVLFGDTDDPQIVSLSTGIRVGDNPSEPITALGLVTISTDNEGQLAQLACFTAKRMMLYSGIQAQSATTGSDFQRVVNTRTGTVSPNAMVQTPMGLVFLGSDKQVYLVRPNDNPRPISRAIDPALKDLTLSQLKVAAATYEDGYYKLSIPNGEDTHNSIQWWADMRFIQGGEYDFGVRWFGPQEGVKIAAFATVRGAEDTFQSYGGQTNTSSIWLLSQEGVTQDGTADIDIEAHTPAFDGRDAHRDKWMLDTRLRVVANKNTTVTGQVVAIGGSNDANDSEPFSEAIVTSNPLVAASGTLVAATGLYVGSKDGFKNMVVRPLTRLRGSLLQAIFKEDSDAEVSFSDFLMRLRPVRRR